MTLGTSANFGLVRCPQCGAALAAESWDRPEVAVSCPNCHEELWAQTFPAIARARPEVRSGEHAMEGEAVCFFHPEKRAALACERCGRFVCELCDMPLGTRHLCPACLGSGLESEKLPELVNRRVVWSKLSFFVGALPLLLFFFWPIFVVSGPAAIGFGIYSWNKPGSLVTGKGRFRAVIGILCGLAQLAFLVGLIVAIWKGTTHASHP